MFQFLQTEPDLECDPSHPHPREYIFPLLNRYKMLLMYHWANTFILPNKLPHPMLKPSLEGSST